MVPDIHAESTFGVYYFMLDGTCMETTGVAVVTTRVVAYLPALLVSFMIVSVGVAKICCVDRSARKNRAVCNLWLSERCSDALIKLNIYYVISASLTSV